MERKKILLVISTVILVSMTILGCDNRITASTLETDIDHKNPSNIVDLSSWKLQLPIAGNNGKVVEEILPSTLQDGYSNSQYFYVDDSSDAITMRCVVNGAKTSNTKYSRTELREMIGSKSTDNWGLGGTHILNTTESVEAVSSTGKIVVAQIHGIYADGTNGPVLVKIMYDYSANGVWAMVKDKTGEDGKDSKSIFSGIELGQKFDTQIKCKDGTAYITISSNGRSELFSYNFLQNDSTWNDYLYYFKVGNYLLDDEEDYSGESAIVKVYRIDTDHDSKE